MDYKELIDRLSAYSAEYQCHGGITAEAVDALKALLLERDAALNDLCGMCCYCVNARRWEKSKNLMTCEHLREKGILAAGGSMKCEYWKWRGTKKEN